MFLGVAIIFYYYFKDGLTAASKSKPFNSLANFPLYFGTTLFAINGVGVVGVIMINLIDFGNTHTSFPYQVIAVENNMKTPQSFAKVMSLAMTIICALYSLFGLFGYLKYGEKCQGTITVNIPNVEM